MKKFSFALLYYNKFYAIDLAPLGYISPVTLLSTPIDINTYRTKFKVLASTISFQEGLQGRILFTPCFTDEINSRGNVYCFELPPELIEKCTIEEVPLNNFPLWIGSPYKSYRFEDLLKG